MKKIIDGKIYDTKTATEVASYWNHLGTGDFRWYSEALYRTRRGNFFLSGEGGAMTRWSHSCGDNSVCGGEGIEPMSPDEAREWCEEHDVDADTIEEYFEVEEA
jgi:hypothetical protein